MRGILNGPGNPLLEYVRGRTWEELGMSGWEEGLKTVLEAIRE